MRCARRLTLAAAFLLPGVLAAHQDLEQARASAFRDAERFVSCLVSGDADCTRELSYVEAYEKSGSLTRDLNALGGTISSVYSAGWGFVMLGPPGPGPGNRFWIEVAEPWQPFAVDADLYAFVPYFASFVDPVTGRRVDRMSYLIGHSANDGESWRLFPVQHELRSKDIDRVIPGHGNAPRPPFREVDVRESQPERSRWLVTSFRQIVPADKGYTYVLAFEIREGLELPIDISMRYDNPANPGVPSRFRGSLEPGQTELRWASPPMEGFEADRPYSVVIEGSDPDTGSLVLEHREELVFPPTRNLWLSEQSKPPQSEPSN